MKNFCKDAPKNSNPDPVARGVSPCVSRYSGDQNFVRCRTPLSHAIVTTRCPGPNARATFTAPTTLTQPELPEGRGEGPREATDVGVGGVERRQAES